MDEYDEYLFDIMDEEWTDEDEAGLEDWEDRKRERIAEDNEY